MSIFEQYLKTVVKDGAQPSFTPDFLPLCTEECQHHDGKRCDLLGRRPDEHCTPALIDIMAKMQDLLLDG